MADYPSKEPIKTIAVTTTIRGITSLLSSLDDIKLLAERLGIPKNATVGLSANRDGWSDSVTFTWDMPAYNSAPKPIPDSNPRIKKPYKDPYWVDKNKISFYEWYQYPYNQKFTKES